MKHVSGKRKGRTCIWNICQEKEKEEKEIVTDSMWQCQIHTSYLVSAQWDFAFLFSPHYYLVSPLSQCMMPPRYMGRVLPIAAKPIPVVVGFFSSFLFSIFIYLFVHSSLTHLLSCHHHHPSSIFPTSCSTTSTTKAQMMHFECIVWAGMFFFFFIHSSLIFLLSCHHPIPPHPPRLKQCIKCLSLFSFIFFLLQGWNRP